MYFTDHFYKRDYWQGRAKPDQEKQRIYYLSKGAKGQVIAEDTQVEPNVTFGGPDLQTLFITAMDSAFTLEMSVPATR